VTGSPTSPEQAPRGRIGVGAVFGDALDLYGRLFVRSVTTAAIVFVPIELVNALATLPNNLLSALGILFAALVLALVGEALVQGSLVELVRDVHEGREPAPTSVLYQRTAPRVASLVGGAFVYGISVFLGLLLLIVPGLILLARLSLIAPLIVLERRPVGDAWRRSQELVRGQSGRVLVTVLLAFVASAFASDILARVFAFLPEFWHAWVGGVVASALTAPFTAHVLTVLYYRLTDPGRPVVAEGKPKAWDSVWDEERRADGD
jgi:hypothetical protein